MFVRQNWKCRTERLNGPKRRSDRKELMKLEGSILLILKMQTVNAHLLFGVVQNLTVDILLGKKFIDGCIKEIFPIDIYLMPIPSALVSILDGDKGPSKVSRVLLPTVVCLKVQAPRPC